MALTDKLTAIADAIRSKGGTTDQLTLAGMVDAINAIQTGGGEETNFNHITTFTPVKSGYISIQLFSELGLTPTHNAGMFVSRGNTDITSDMGNFMLILFYTESRYICILIGSYNGSIQIAATAPSDREETGVGGHIGVPQVGNVRTAYSIVGKQYNVYEAELSAEFAGRIIDYVEETA